MKEVKQQQAQAQDQQQESHQSPQSPVETQKQRIKKQKKQKTKKIKETTGKKLQRISQMNTDPRQTIKRKKPWKRIHLQTTIKNSSVPCVGTSWIRIPMSIGLMLLLCMKLNDCCVKPSSYQCSFQTISLESVNHGRAFSCLVLLVPVKLSSQKLLLLFVF